MRCSSSQRRRSSCQSGRRGLTEPNGSNSTCRSCRQASASRRLTPADVAVKQAVQTADPGLADAVLAVGFDQPRQLVAGRAAKRPAGEVGVDVDDHASAVLSLRRIGASRRRRLPPRINRLASSGSVGAGDLGQLRGEAAAARVAAVDHAFGPQFAHGHLDEAGRGIRAADFGPDVLRRADHPNAAFPVVARMGTDEGRVGMPRRQRGHVGTARTRPAGSLRRDRRRAAGWGLSTRPRGARADPVPGRLQRIAIHSFTPTIGPSATQRSNSRRLPAVCLGFRYTMPSTRSGAWAMARSTSSFCLPQFVGRRIRHERGAHEHDQPLRYPAGWRTPAAGRSALRRSPARRDRWTWASQIADWPSSCALGHRAPCQRSETAVRGGRLRRPSQQHAPGDGWESIRHLHLYCTSPCRAPPDSSSSCSIGKIGPNECNATTHGELDPGSFRTAGCSRSTRPRDRLRPWSG